MLPYISSIPNSHIYIITVIEGEEASYYHYLIYYSLSYPKEELQMMKKSDLMANMTYCNDIKVVKGIAVTAEVTTMAVVTLKTGSLVKGACCGTLAGIGVAAVGSCIAVAHANSVKADYLYADEEVVIEGDGYDDDDIFG